MVKAGDIGGCGGGSLEQPRQWLGAQWAGLSPGSAELPRTARRALSQESQEPSWGLTGALPRGHFEHAVALDLALDLPPRPEAVGQRPGAALDGQCVGLLRDRARDRARVRVGVGVGGKHCGEEASTLALTTQPEPCRGLP